MDDQGQVETVEADLPDAGRPDLFASLKDGDCFLVADANGDIAGGSDGFFDDGTRLLSRFRLLIGGKPASALGAGVSRNNVLFAFDGANRPLPAMGQKA